MKKAIVILVFMCFAAMGYAQQDPAFSQYMFNGFVLNPAYAGSHDKLNGSLFYRRQWDNFPGFPHTQSLSIDMPFGGQRHGAGISILNDQIGVSGITHVNLGYAYRIRLGPESQLALGLQGTISNYRNDIDQLLLEDPTDDAALANAVRMLRPNAGAGIFYNSRNFFAGFSVPHLLETSLVNNGYSFESKLHRNYLLTAGAIFPIGNNLKLRPSFLAKYTQGLKIPEVDVNASLLIKDFVWIGLTYRTIEDLVGSIVFQINQNWRVGYAYDYSFSEVGTYMNAAHEIFLGFEIPTGKEQEGKTKVKFESPRFF